MAGTFRIDAGVDVASALALPGNPVHIIPCVGVGMMPGAVASPSVMHARMAATPCCSPLLTVATVRTVDGWSANLMLDITASMQEHRGDSD